MNHREENYISVVAVLRNDEKNAERGITEIYNMLESHFKYFEVIVVDNFSTDGTGKILTGMKLPVTVVTLSCLHGIHQALTAGAEIAVGDYIVEIPDISVDFKCESVWDLYTKCQEGYDFVFLTPKSSHWSSECFYKILNRYFSGRISARVRSSIVTLSSRRGRNKTADVGRKLINSSVSYILTGLPCAFVTADTRYNNRRGLAENVSLMLDTLIYYTDYITNAVIKLTLLFFLITAAGVVYGLAMYFGGIAVTGWTSTFVMCGAAFSFLFLLLMIFCKYLTHILNAGNTKNYNFSSVIKKEKPQ